MDSGIPLSAAAYRPPSPTIRGFVLLYRCLCQRFQNPVGRRPPSQRRPTPPLQTLIMISPPLQLGRRIPPISMPSPSQTCLRILPSMLAKALRLRPAPLKISAPEVQGRLPARAVFPRDRGRQIPQGSPSFRRRQHAVVRRPWSTSTLITAPSTWYLLGDKIKSTVKLRYSQIEVEANAEFDQKNTRYWIEDAL